MGTGDDADAADLGGSNALVGVSEQGEDPDDRLFDGAEPPRGPSKGPSALGYLWWCVCLHTLGVWRYGPLGYYRFRRSFDRAMDQFIRDHG